MSRINVPNSSINSSVHLSLGIQNYYFYYESVNTFKLVTSHITCSSLDLIFLTFPKPNTYIISNMLVNFWNKSRTVPMLLYASVIKMSYDYIQLWFRETYCFIHTTIYQMRLLYCFSVCPVRPLPIIWQNGKCINLIK